MQRGGRRHSSSSLLSFFFFLCIRQLESTQPAITHADSSLLGQDFKQEANLMWQAIKP